MYKSRLITRIAIINNLGTFNQKSNKEIKNKNNKCTESKDIHKIWQLVFTEHLASLCARKQIAINLKVERARRVTRTTKYKPTLLESEIYQETYGISQNWGQFLVDILLTSW